MLLLLFVFAFAYGQDAVYPSCGVPLCQSAYGGRCGELPCCSTGETRCLRHANGCDLTGGEVFRCAIPGGVGFENVFRSYQPRQPDAIFASCGRFVEDQQPQVDQLPYLGGLFRSCGSNEAFGSCGQ